MKKRIVCFLCLIVAMVMLTACGEKVEVTQTLKNEASVTIQLVANYLNVDGQITDYTDEERELQLGFDEQTWPMYAEVWKQNYGINITLDAYQNGIKSYMSSQEEIGQVLGITSIAAKYNADKKLMTVSQLDCESREAEMYITYDADMQIESIKINPIYSFGENMGRAALNTLMGMGVVFVVLILISLIISLFSYIPKLQAAFSKKKDNKTEEKNGSMDNTIQQIISKEEDELADDCELVAVIAAAIAAYEGTSTDGFVVRSIKKSAKWQRS